jgi:holo-[acyl-carrier protein] synthase
MIAGIGTDMIEVERVAQKIGRSDGFREWVFSQKEIDYCESKTSKFEHYAARWAAKKAFFKAMGTGWTTDTAYREVEITHGENGQPELTLLAETQKSVAGAFGIIKFFVSLSHVRTMATAVVIIEKCT